MSAVKDMNADEKQRLDGFPVDRKDMNRNRSVCGQTINQMGISRGLRFWAVKTINNDRFEKKAGNGMDYENELFEGIEMQDEILSEKIFTDCTFIKCKFYEGQIEHCSFNECSFENCTILNSRFKYTDGKNNTFKNCTLIGVDWTSLLRSGKTVLPFDRFEECTLKYNSFAHMKLRRFDFSECDLTGSFFEGCDLTESRFRNTELSEVSFAENNMTGADFRDAKEYAISLENNRLKKARFSFPEALNLLTASGILVD